MAITFGDVKQAIGDWSPEKRALAAEYLNLMEIYPPFAERFASKTPEAGGGPPSDNSKHRPGSLILAAAKCLRQEMKGAVMATKETNSDPELEAAKDELRAGIKEMARAEAAAMLADEQKPAEPNPSLGFMAASAKQSGVGVFAHDVNANAYASGTEPGICLGGKSYSQHRAPGKHIRTGQEIESAWCDNGPACRSSEFDFAVCGAYAKRLAQKSVRPDVRWGGEEESLWDHVSTKQPWVGSDQGALGGARLKSILDSATSGGSYLNPAIFDNSIVAELLLHGELLPHVEQIAMDRGSTINGASISAPSVTWGTTEGSAASLFDTASLISQLSNSVYPVTCFLEMGLDLLDDSAVNLGQLLIRLIGEKLKETLDEQIAIGDGTQEPTGIFTASGVTSVSATNGTSGPLTISDLETLALSIGKQYHTANLNAVFLTRQLLYRKARQLAVSGSDPRRLLGLNHSSWSLLEWPCKLQESIPLGSIAFCCLRKYRLWRRKGMQVKFATDGQTLALKNTGLLIVRGRYGGNLMDGSACATMTDGPISIA